MGSAGTSNSVIVMSSYYDVTIKVGWPSGAAIFLTSS